MRIDITRTRTLSGLTTAVVIAIALLPAFGGRLRAQNAARAVTTDSRWTPWLGCWQPDTARATVSSGPTLTCVVPVAGSAAVEALSVTDGKIAARRRLDANDRPHA